MQNLCELKEETFLESQEKENLDLGDILTWYQEYT